MRHLFNKYELWVVSTLSSAQLYRWENWRHLFPLVDNLVKLSPAQAFIRTRQAYEDEDGWLGFGRMSWNRENNEKWTEKYRENAGAESRVRFFDTQIWAPDWNQVEKTGLPPDLFVRLFSEPESRVAKEGLIFAAKRALAEKHSAAIESIITGISSRVPEPTVRKVTRSWFSGGGFVNWIQDMNPQELEMIVQGNIPPPLAHRFRAFLRSM